MSLDRTDFTTKFLKELGEDIQQFRGCASTLADSYVVSGKGVEEEESGKAIECKQQLLDKPKLVEDESSHLFDRLIKMNERMIISNKKNSKIFFDKP